MNRLLLVADHPALHGGFSTVGAHVARSLHGTLGWEVAYVARQAAPTLDAPLPFPVYAPDAFLEDSAARNPIASLVSDLLHEVPPQTRTPLLCIGTPLDQRLLLDALESKERSRIQFVAYMPIDFAPLPPGVEAALRRFDVVVPFTEHARRTLLPWCGIPGSPRLCAPIPHGVDRSIFRPPDAEARRIARREVLGVGDDAMVVGFFGRNSGHKHAELAMRIFTAFAKGHFVRCADCTRITPFDVDPIDFSAIPPERCARCGGESVEPSRARRTARLYLHTEASSALDRSVSGGWDLDLLADRLGIENALVRDGSIRLGQGVSAEELARRMGACDVHLLPYDCGAFELTVLETGACGVPNVITDGEAPVEYAAPFSELVPPAMRWIAPEGTRAFMDPGLAVEALVRLAEEPERRRSLAEEGPRVAERYTWEGIGARWDQLFRSLDPATDAEAAR